MKRQLQGGFKVVEYYYFDNENTLRKRVLRKGLDMSEAEDFIYRLERKQTIK